MRKMLCVLYILLFTCASWGQVNTSIRKNIIPLHSTRSDVEKMAILVKKLGVNYTYETDNETLDVYYSTARCVWHGWNVEPDTVISYRVYSKKPAKFDTVSGSLNQLTKTIDDATFRFYTNLADGIQYRVSQENIISYIKYIPSESDSDLRCKGFPKFNPITEGYERYKSYKIENITDWDIGLIGALLAKVEQSTKSNGYIFIYGKKEDKAKLEKLKKNMENFAYNIHKSNSQRVKIFFGGFRDGVEIETFLLPSEYPPPIPNPKYPL